MSVVVPFNRRGFVVRPSVSVLPLPARAATDPALTLAARAVGVDLAAVRWGGGITLLAAATDGPAATIQARVDDGQAVDSVALVTTAATTVSAPGGQGGASLHLRPARGGQMVAAIARHADGHLSGVVAEVRLSL